MTIKHHPEESTLLAYATNNLPEAFNLIVASHVSLCDECRAIVESHDTLGGALIETGTVASMDTESLDRALARLDVKTMPERKRHTPGTLPTPLQDYVGGDVDSIRWQPVGMGVKQAILPTSSAATARLLYIPAGAAMPHHSHKGTEMTLVLQGAFEDEDGRFARGDVEVADADVHHTPIADIGEDCICLAVTEAPLRFKGWLPRIMQRFVRI
ncbi:ChrR family anti-sigma-E factor [Sulfitobacter aestuariivivens]|uniref:Cupin domain-containing protein n=1 Tax=Sulfitobacter aestuariivivens TaxID=2766981 RepID=A0A927D8M3_9RHOB|nr:ChrR family anti-sigma-E factor [Sulfitobacter aestuariivivens]MBD3665774.1 cupin domain-containing protein [Sulfitobacter aestuariivivens]